MKIIHTFFKSVEIEVPYNKGEDGMFVVKNIKNRRRKKMTGEDKMKDKNQYGT